VHSRAISFGARNLKWGIFHEVFLLSRAPFTPLRRLTDWRKNRLRSTFDPMGELGVTHNFCWTPEC
jgi:hypothetical protein